MSLIDSLNDYCTAQQVNMNCDETKIMVFGQNPKTVTVNFRWKIGGQSLMIVGKYKYLGIWLNWNCQFNLTESVGIDFHPSHNLPSESLASPTMPI